MHHTEAFLQPAPLVTLSEKISKALSGMPPQQGGPESM
jgi:hypothetical protein